jgi:hypothetical protein
MELSGDKPRAFTAKANGLASVLISKAYIGEPYDPQYGKASTSPVEYTAIWDTGATGTVITEKVVQDCGLKPVSITQVHTSGGERNCAVYFVSVYLPNKVVVPQLRVTEGILFGPAEILIGMDIIRLGDFAITNKNKKTVFTFRMPSMEVIDFVKQAASTSSTNVIPATTGDRAARRRAKFGR